MHNFFKYIRSLIRDSEEPYVRLAEIEYGAEFQRFVSVVGRRPTNQEAKTFLLAISE